LLYLQSWWSREYNRPLKDPLLDSYTIEELTYEYYDRIERRKASEETLDLESDKIEEDEMQANLDWAAEEERKELEELERVRQGIEQQGKEEHGEDFGEDLNIDFSE
jgi:hypothetical protein